MSEENNRILDQHIGKKIKDRRKSLQLTQQDLAQILGLSHQQVQRYETGENTISMPRLLQVANVLNVKPNYFFDDAPATTQEQVSSGMIRREPNRAIKLLLVEDSTSDALLFRKAVEKSPVSVEMEVEQFPEKVMERLITQAASPRALPDLIVLDINMPRMNGLDLLEKIKGNAALASIAVVVLTHSIRSKDMLDAYRFGASGFIQKHSDLIEFYDHIHRILLYWSQTVVLPSAA